jgi:hypothetical protein
MIVVPSNRSSIATCLWQKPVGNGTTDPRTLIKKDSLVNGKTLLAQYK